MIEHSGERATSRFVEFFTATSRNPNTPAAYAQACAQFLGAIAAHNLSLERIDAVHVAIYVERLTQECAAPTVKQHLAAIRQLLRNLVTGQVLPFNPAASVKEPKHVTREGKTPILRSHRSLLYETLTALAALPDIHYPRAAGKIPLGAK